MNRSPFFIAGLAASLLLPIAATAQTSNGQPNDQPPGTTSVTDNAPMKKGKPAKEPKAPKQSKAEKKADKVVQSKDTKQQIRKEKKASKNNPLAGLDKNSPDKELYDKALDAMKRGRYEIARLDLQTMMNTYPDSEYLMRAKLAFADSWYREGGTAALDQAESEYKDFITFFPNVPEAAEAQLRVGDIYFKEMDKSDRDLSKAEGAQREYRNMLTQFPDAPKELTEQATQRLRDVQEVLATREADTGNFYASHENWYAALAHYETVVETYPLFSHMDEVLINMGDIYELRARSIGGSGLQEDAKARLEKQNHDMAEKAYDTVVLEHAAAPHVEDAKDRLAAMGRPIPTPSAEQLAASTALENSRSSYTFASRASLLLMHKPDVVQSAHLGAPTLTDPPLISAPQVYHKGVDDLNLAVKGISPSESVVAPAAAAGASAAPEAVPGAAPAAGTGGGALKFEEVPTATTGGPIGTSTSVNTSAPASGGTSMGMEIVTPTTPAAAPATTPAAPATKPAANGLSAVGPTDNKPLPAIEKAAEAPDQVNEVKPGASAPATTTTTSAANNKKKPKNAPVDTSSESSSKKKPKKGLGKLNPF